MAMYVKGTPWQIAGFRAVVAAVIVGALGLLATWATTNDAKTLAIAGLTPFLTTLAVRFGIEGYVDHNNPSS